MRKLILISLIIVVASFLSIRYASAFDMCDQNCSKCHTLTANGAKAALSTLVPDVKVLEVKNGPIKGLWEVGIQTRGRKMIVYLDYSKKKIIAGNIIDLASRQNYTRESYLKINPPPPPKKVDFASIPLKNSIIMGNKNAKHKVVVFIDPA